jgi:hypothetical protein
MNIQDAARSGKRFRRRGRSHWIATGNVYSLSRESLAADDLEIEEEAVCITKSDLFDAYRRITETQDDLSLWNGMVIGLLWEEMSKQKENTSK